MNALSPRLQTLVLTGLERWRYFSQRVITYPTTVVTGKKATSPRSPRRRGGPQTDAVRKLARERETFTVDDLPQFDRLHLSDLCRNLVRKGELRRVQVGKAGHNGRAAVYSRMNDSNQPAAQLGKLSHD